MAKCPMARVSWQRVPQELNLSIRDLLPLAQFERYRHLHDLLPAMGYSAQQRHELEETINATPCDVVIVATPVDLGLILKINKPAVRVGYEAKEVAHPGLTELLDEFAEKNEFRRAAPVLSR